jgi:hypothetical protein
MQFNDSCNYKLDHCNGHGTCEISDFKGDSNINVSSSILLRLKKDHMEIIYCACTNIVSVVFSKEGCCLWFALSQLFRHPYGNADEIGEG